MTPMTYTARGGTQQELQSAVIAPEGGQRERGGMLGEKDGLRMVLHK
jgi:hypothetical protein